MVEQKCLRCGVMWESLELSYYVKISNNLVEESQALVLSVIVMTHLEELLKVHYRCEHDADVLIALVVQVLKSQRF